MSTQQQLERYKAALQQIAEFHGQGSSLTPWREITASLGKIARDALADDQPADIPSDIPSIMQTPPMKEAQREAWYRHQLSGG